MEPRLKISSENNPRKSRAKVKKEKSKPLYTLEKTDLQCKICGETFVMHKSLVMHMPAHFPLQVCEFCGRGFATRKQLHKHRAVHLGSPRACARCGRVLKDAPSLRAHARRHQEGALPVHRCPHCAERFPSYSQRRSHLQVVHAIEAKKYPCKQCPMACNSSGALKEHFRRNHLKERPHCCFVCSKSFFSSSEVSRHMLSHTGRKDFPCAVCGKRYQRRTTREHHMKTHHADKAL